MPPGSPSQFAPIPLASEPTSALLGVWAITPLIKETVMKKRTIATYAAILLLLWGTREMSAFHYASATNAIAHFQQLAQS